jgi:hypothetical protein
MALVAMSSHRDRKRYGVGAVKALCAFMQPPKLSELHTQKPV